MFETIFKTELTNINSDKLLVNQTWQEISSGYSSYDRYYHNLEHLDNLINELSTIKDKIDDWQTVVFSVAYHDIIYNVLRSDNEEKSADLAFERLTLLEVGGDKKEKCREHILATKRHLVSRDSDTNYFTDADLCILGSESLFYNVYTSQIRKEYNFYPDLLYKRGRRKLLKHFLNLTNIYKTEYFSEKYERQARENIGRELKELS